MIARSDNPGSSMRLITKLFAIFLVVMASSSYALADPLVLEGGRLSVTIGWDEHVVVMLEGTIPSDVELPLAVEIPVPDKALAPILAFRDEAGNLRHATGTTPPTAGVPVPEALVGTLSEREVHIEWFFPYAPTEPRTRLVVAWPGGLRAEHLEVTILGPFGAKEMMVLPLPSSSGERGNGPWADLRVEGVEPSDVLTLDIAFTPASSAEGAP